MDALLQRAGATRGIGRTTAVVVPALVTLVVLLCIAAPATAYRSGRLVWSRAGGTAAHQQEFRAVAKAPNGMVYAAGRVYSSSTKGDDILVCKVNARGRLKWAKTWDGGGNAAYGDFAWAAVSDATGALYVTGFAARPTTGYDVVTLKYAPSGRRSWVKRWSDASADTAQPAAIALTKGGVIVAADEYPHDAPHAAVVLSYSARGVPRWSRVLGADAGDPDDGDRAAVDVAVNARGDAFLAYTAGHAGVWQAAAAKLAAADGTVVQTWTYDAAAGSYANAIALRGSVVALTGWAAQVADQEGALAVRFDTALSERARLEYQEARGETSREFGYDVAVGTHGRIVVGGMSNYPRVSSAFWNSALLFAWDGRSTSPTWHKLYRPTSRAAAEGDRLVLDGADNVYLGGCVTTDSYGQDVLVVKHSAAGRYRWARMWRIKGQHDDQALALMLGVTPTLYVAGVARGADDDKRGVLLRYDR